MSITLDKCDEKIFMFIDFTNVLAVPGCNILNPLLPFEKLCKTIEGERKITETILVGSVTSKEYNILNKLELPAEKEQLLSLLEQAKKTSKKANPLLAVWPYALEKNYRVEYLCKVRVPNRQEEMGLEQGVDEAIIGYMLEKFVDHSEPGTIILVSGDGNKGAFGYGFFDIIGEFLRKGWKVEVVGWKNSMNHDYLNLAKLYKNRMKVSLLDERKYLPRNQLMTPPMSPLRKFQKKNFNKNSP